MKDIIITETGIRMAHLLEEKSKRGFLTNKQGRHKLFLGFTVEKIIL